MYIVTGGAGFIGSVMVWKLNQEGIDDIIVVDKLRNEDKWKNLRKKSFNDYIDKEEFLDKLENNLFDNIEGIIHIGACSSTTETNADYMMKNNYEYTKRVALWSISNNVRFLYASSAATYGNGEFGYSDDDENTIKLKPMNIYGFSKHFFDLWVLKNKLQNKIAGFKYFNVYGPNEYHKKDMMSVICKAYSQIKTTGRLKLFKSYKPGIADGEQKRDFVYVKDIVDIMYFFLVNKDKNGIFNAGTGKARSFNALAEASFYAMNKKTNIKYIPMPEEIRDRYQYFTEAKLDKLRAAGYNKEFTSLENGVKDYVRNYLMNEEDPYL